MNHLTLIAFCLSLISAPAWALRCGNQLVNVGDYEYEVIQDCGEPVSISERLEPGLITIWNHNRHEYVDVISPIVTEAWLYDFGPSRFMRRLVFRDGVLERIDILGYGGHYRAINR